MNMTLNEQIQEYLALQFKRIDSKQSPTNSLEHCSLSSTSSATTTGGGGSITSSGKGSSSSSFVEDMLSARATKASTGSPNITENVCVPTSEHVAEIVGRQGCKIKALRSKTNTYIKTPTRGEPPMFLITGRRDDVLTAKAEIQLAAEHFTQIRAQRRSSGGSSRSRSSTGSEYSLMFPHLTTSSLFDFTALSSSIQSTSKEKQETPQLNKKSILVMLSNVCSSDSSSASISPPPQPQQLIMSGLSTINRGISSSGIFASSLSECTGSLSLPAGHVSEKVAVPYNLVGLVVGPKGATIKRIQQNTQTYILTPGRDTPPVFEIQGAPENVVKARVEIEHHVMMRTGYLAPSAAQLSVSKTGSGLLSSLSAWRLGDQIKNEANPLLEPGGENCVGDSMGDAFSLNLAEFEDYVSF